MEMVRGPGEQLGLGLARQPDTRAIIIETIRQVLQPSKEVNNYLFKPD